MRKEILLLLGAVLFCNSSYAVNRDWMSHISSNRLISAINIPGTHDSAAYQSTELNERFVPWWSWKTQHLDINQQLNAGIRFFDIRCRHQSDACVLHHGMISLDQNLGSVLDTIYSFLKAHPNETVLMSVKDNEWNDDGKEPDEPGFPQTMRNYINDATDYWYTDSSIPKLGSVRGRIVLIRRYGGETDYGIDATNWANNTAFRTSLLYVQDYYDFGLQKSKAEKADAAKRKWNDIFAALMEAKGGVNGTGPYLFMNFTSYVTFGSNIITDSAPDIDGYTAVNPKLSSFMKNHRHFSWGVMVMDHPSTDLINSIINAN